MLVLRCPSPTGCAQHARCIGSATVPAGLHKRHHDACSHATGPRYAMLGPARAEPCRLYHPVACIIGHWKYTCASPFVFFRLLRFKPPQAWEPAWRTHSARTCHACSSSRVTTSCSPSDTPTVPPSSCALLASKSAWPLVPQPLTPATLQSAALSIGSQLRAQLSPGTVPGPDDSPPGDNLPWPFASQY